MPDPKDAPHVGVCLLAGRDTTEKNEVSSLATIVRQVAIKSVEGIDSTRRFHFSDVHDSVERLHDTLDQKTWPILQIISHGDASGELLVNDIWKGAAGDRLRLKPDNLAGLLRNQGVEVAVVCACHGAEAARILVDKGAVQVAIGITRGHALKHSAAVSFSTAFYPALARGDSIEQAFEEARRLMHARDPDNAVQMKIFDRDNAARNDRLLEPPMFYLIGSPDAAHVSVVDNLRAGLKPHILFHEGDLDREILPGDVPEDVLLERLGMARVVMVVQQGDPAGDGRRAELVARAVRRAATHGLTLFPLYLKGREHDENVDFGLFRVHPAFLENREGKPDLDALLHTLRRVAQKAERRRR